MADTHIYDPQFLSCDPPLQAKVHESMLSAHCRVASSHQFSSLNSGTSCRRNRNLCHPHQVSVCAPCSSSSTNCDCLHCVFSFLSRYNNWRHLLPSKSVFHTFSKPIFFTVRTWFLQSRQQFPASSFFLCLQFYAHRWASMPLILKRSSYFFFPKCIYFYLMCVGVLSEVCMCTKWGPGVLGGRK